MPAAAPPAPPAKKETAKIVIPPLAQITPGAAAGPIGEQGGLGDRGTPVPPVVPPVTPPTAIAPPPADDESGIPTNIIDPKQKTSGQFAAERRESKQVKLSVEEAQRAADEAKAEVARLMTAEEERTRKITEAEKQRDEFKAEAERLRGEVDNVNTRYFQTNEATLNPASDEELRDSSGKLFTALTDKMPSRVTTADGSEKRVFMEQFMQTPAIASAMEKLVGHYAFARQQSNAEGMDLAVNAAAQMLGANAFVGERSEENKLLQSNDPVFMEIEAAFKEAIPHFVTKQRRLQAIQQEGPKIAAQKLAKKEQTIRTRLESAIFMEEKDVTARLQSNPTDSHALFAAIVNRAPHLRQVVEAKLTSYATAYSRMREGIELPTLTKNDPVSIAEHRRQVDQINETLSQAASAAVIGDSVGPILASLIAERDAAVERADAAALNTNPGAPKPGDDSRSIPGAIDTEIVKE